MDHSFDLAIAGGGAAGVITAVRYAHQFPEAKVVIIERDDVLGGRLRTTDVTLGSWGYGMRHIGDSLFNLWGQTLREDPEADDLPSFVTNDQAHIGVLQGGKIRQVPLNEFMTKKGARIIGGLAAGREWQKIEDILEKALEEGFEDASFAQLWSGNRKSAGAVVIEHMGRCLGIPDVWNASVSALESRAKRLSHTLRAGRWEKALHTMIESSVLSERIHVATGCMIVDANHDDDVWTLDTEKGDFKARHLVVAQSPWEAMLWLPKSHWPARTLNTALKSKPVSVVSLSDNWTGEAELPEILIIPSENVQAVIDHQAKEISFQATIDYELSLQAPDVVKAVKRLRRARRKVLNYFPELQTSGDHLALVPVGWAQSPIYRDRRHVTQWKPADLHTKALTFCGDAYGPSYDGDENCTSSILSACEALGTAEGSA